MDRDTLKMILENSIWIIEIWGILYFRKESFFWLVVDTVIFLVLSGTEIKSITHSEKEVNFYDNQIKIKIREDESYAKRLVKLIKIG